MSGLDESITRCVRAAYDEWTGPLPPLLAITNSSQS